MRKRILPLLFAIALACGMRCVVFAHDVPQLDKSGTIELSVVPCSEIALYRVGNIIENDGNYSFELLEKYREQGIVLDDVRSYALAAELAECAEDGVSQAADEDGNVIFAVEAGLYLVVQTKEGQGNFLFEPFLISMPNYQEGKYCYEVKALPKCGYTEVTEPTPPPETTPPDEKLPQTGQMNWPVPLLAVSGLMLFIAGWCLCAGKRE